ncbi:hypothetical protein KPH14_004099 [Odynerus spinipes]|uniref:EF-hand domain-containing protein n=1 Tax=Odynerus spinipes TaxID=1348599 RepID=A0AAD9RYN6_9HYME|nr:hypothetical protein KPH14_004099 [Odynerus spinipes]
MLLSLCHRNVERKMYWFHSLILCSLLVQISVAPPVTKDKAEENAEQHEGKENDMEVMEYHRYLNEIISTLESDPDFREKLVKAAEHDIWTGKIANELKFVSHKVRTRLDELKRKELERLRHLAMKENQLNNGLDLEHLKIAQHLDHSNKHFFEIDDLKKLIAKTTADLAEADRRRREQFKEYEMQKKFEQEQKMNAMSNEEKQKYVQELQELREKHKKHDPLHHPGSKQQLEEVWEQQDHMDSQDFDLQKFFYLHDVDGNGVWDQNEVKALFLKDLSKLYPKGGPEEDLLEREEEMERMREHVFNEADLNKDGLISYQEFLELAKKPDFQQDPGWEALDEQQIYSQEEYEAFEKRRREEAQLHDMQFTGQHGNDLRHPQAGDNLVPPQQYQYQGQPIQQQQYHPQQIQVPQQHYQGGQFHGQEQLHPNQIHLEQQQHHNQQQPQHPNVQAQIPQQQHPNVQAQVPQQQHPNVQAQIPQQQQQQNAPNQIPQQHNTQNQIPQQQAVPNQTPQQQNAAGQNSQNHVTQEGQQPVQNSAHVQQNSIHSAGKV